MLEWKAYCHDRNERKIEPFNIFDHGRFYEDCQKNARKNAKDYDKFCDQLRKDLFYYFCSKCEWEIVITPWVGQAPDEKIDVYDQVMINWEQFCGYVWAHAVELRRREKK